MQISQIHLTNFKRFSDLQVVNIPTSSKLVLLLGTNGSGKSSLFDAFGFINSAIKRDVRTNDEFWKYFRKKADTPFSVKVVYDDNKQFTIDQKFDKPPLGKNAFYGRTSFRQIPQLTRTALGQGEQFDLENDADRPKYFIERDNRFENDVEKVTETILKDFFRSKNSNDQIKQKYIDPINKALVNIFGTGNGTKLQLIEIIPPLEGKVAQIGFTKGESEIHYNYLSAGEKEVFNLLINLLTRINLYQDTIYFFDEIDLHLNTRIQYNLLKEITEHWIPENCQLWTATHSLGFIEYAKQAKNASIIDFDDLDFDLPQILSPEPKDNPEIYEIAVGKEFLPALFQQMNIIFVENKDKEYYAAIGIEKSVFVSENNRNNVYHKVKTNDYYGIVDRDFLSDDDIIHIRNQYKNLFILNYYSVENYLYHPENLEAYHHALGNEFDKVQYVKDLTEAKNLIKDSIIPTLSLKRTEYPYFGEPVFNGKPLQNRFKNRQENAEESIVVAGYLNSNEFEIFYKSLPMKTYCTQLPQRQHIAKSELAQTQWFRLKIEAILQFGSR